MAKTNFTKVEEALRDGLDKMLKESLLEEADAAQGKPSQKQHTTDQLLAKIRHEFKYLYKIDKEVFQKIGINDKILKELLLTTTSLTQKDIDVLKEVLRRIESYRTEMQKKNPQASDEQLIEDQKKKHINKRFNVRDDWLPLQ
jgi:hypothetical protein